MNLIRCTIGYPSTTSNVRLQNMRSRRWSQAYPCPPVSSSCQGAVKLIEAAKKAGIRRFVLLSSVFADEPEKWGDPALAGITDYNIAKFFADQWLVRDSGLDYTIVQPGNLLDEPGRRRRHTRPRGREQGATP